MRIKVTTGRRNGPVEEKPPVGVPNKKYERRGGKTGREEKERRVCKAAYEFANKDKREPEIN